MAQRSFHARQVPRFKRRTSTEPYRCLLEQFSRSSVVTRRICRHVSCGKGAVPSAGSASRVRSGRGLTCSSNQASKRSKTSTHWRKSPCAKRSRRQNEVPDATQMLCSDVRTLPKSQEKSWRTAHSPSFAFKMVSMTALTAGGCGRTRQASVSASSGPKRTTEESYSRTVSAAVARRRTLISPRFRQSSFHTVRRSCACVQSPSSRLLPF